MCGRTHVERIDCRHSQWRICKIQLSSASCFQQIEPFSMSIGDIVANRSFRLFLIKFDCHHHERRRKRKIKFRFRNGCLGYWWSNHIWIRKIVTCCVEIKECIPSLSLPVEPWQRIKRRSVLMLYGPEASVKDINMEWGGVIAFLALATLFHATLNNLPLHLQSCFMLR